MREKKKGIGIRKRDKGEITPGKRNRKKGKKGRGKINSGKKARKGKKEN